MKTVYHLTQWFSQTTESNPQDPEEEAADQ